MSNKKKIKVIGDVEHHGNMPKQQGKLLWFLCGHSLLLLIFMLFGLIVIEILGFACLYKTVSLLPFTDCFKYSIFSVLGETVADSVQNSLLINYIIAFQVIFTNCTISFFIPIVLYKLINIQPELIKMEDHVVFEPETGTLKWRIANVSKFTFTKVHIDANFRIHLPGKKRHANAELPLKVNDINSMRPYKAWNIATKPFRPEHKEEAALDVDRYDRERIYEFVPDLLSEKYRSDEPEKARRSDYNNLNMTVTIKAPLFGNEWVYAKSFKAEDFVCGQYISLDPHISGKNVTDWSNWEVYDDMSGNYCKECIFEEHCGIIKTSQKYNIIS